MHLGLLLAISNSVADMTPVAIRNEIEQTGHGPEGPLVKKAGALAKDVMTGAGEARKIVSVVALDSCILVDTG